MKKELLTLSYLFLGTIIFGQTQQPPTADSPSQGGVTNANHWGRAGNNGGFPTTNSNNIIGTNWDSPMFFRLGGSSPGDYRMKINGALLGGSQYAINGYTQSANGINAAGYVLMGDPTNLISNSSIQLYRDRGAFSRLHLNGADVFTEAGYRPWMKTGVTFTDNRDLSYFGMRKLSTQTSTVGLTETVLLWSDNLTNNASPDNLVIRFTNHDSGGATVLNNRLSASDLDGLHVAQFTPFGTFGLGNVFGINAPGMIAGYDSPQSLMHLSYDYRSGAEFNRYGFMQITYKDNPLIGSGVTENDGLRFGIDNAPINGGLNGYLRWQENTPFIIQTDWDNLAGGIENGERMRISSAASANVPLSAENLLNATRVSINYNGLIPIIQPRALLHLGYDNMTSDVASWMDKGVLISTDDSQGGRSSFLGITPSTDTISPNYPVLGFGAADLLMMSANNGEMVRLDNISGNLGVGNFGATGLNTQPSEKIDANGNARLRIVPTVAADYLMLGVKQNNADDVIFSKLAFSQDPNDVLLGDGTWGTLATGGGYFNCSNTSADMLFDSRFNLNGNNFYFEGNSGTTGNRNQVGIGYQCASPLGAKIDVLQNDFSLNNPLFGQSMAGYFHSNYDGLGNGNGGYIVGAFGHATSGNNVGQNMGYVGLIGRTGISASGINNFLFDYGVFGSASSNDTTKSFAGYFTGQVFHGGALVPSDKNLKRDIQPLENALDIINNLSSKTYYFDQANHPEFQFNSKMQYGFISQEVQKIIPAAVQEVIKPLEFDERGNAKPHSGETILGMNYNAIIPINSAAIKELNVKVESTISENEALKKENEELANRLTQLENCLSNLLPYLCQLNQSAIEANTPEEQQVIKAQLAVKLSNRALIVLNQNVPNPFAEQTMISYSIPESVKNAKINFYDAQGKLIESVEIKDRGLGNLSVYGNDLTSGYYSYSLIADGIIVSTLKMVKQ